MLDNSIAIATFSSPTNLLVIDSHVTVEHYDDNPFDFIVEARALHYPFAYDAEEALNLSPFLGSIWPSDQLAITHWLNQQQIVRSGETFALLGQLCRTISQSMRYQQREEQGVQSPATTLSLGSGSCRDLATLFMEACRQLGLAARFVSGYHTSYENEQGNGSTHAWAEVYLPGAGWKGFDPSSGLVTAAEHIAVAVARHPESVAPVSGSFLGPSDLRPTMDVVVHVRETR